MPCFYGDWSGKAACGCASYINNLYIHASDVEIERVVAMPIIIKLEKILIQQKIPFPVFIEMAGITRSNLSILKSNKAKLIRFTSLEAICKALNCQPGDILEHLPDTRENKKVEISRSKEVQQL